MESFDRQMRILEGPAGERPNEATPAFQLDAMRSVRQHPRLAAFVSLIVLVAIVGYALTRKPMYEARSLSYVEPLETKVISDGSQGIYDSARYDSYFQQQIQTATRQDILETAIAKLPEGVWQEPNEDIHSAAERLGNALKVERVGSSYQLSISAQADNPEKASAIVNAATNAYLEQGRKDENARSDGRLVLLQEESQRIQKELDQDRTEQTVLNQTLGVADAQTSGANPYDMQLAGVRTELVAAREAHDVAGAQLASVTARGGLSSAGLKAIADEAIAGDTGLSALKTTINDRRAVLNAQMAALTPTNPVYKQDADEIASMDKQVDARTTQLRQTAAQRVEDKLRLELQRTGDVESRLNGELAHATALAGSAAPKLQRAKDLAADITRLQTRYATVDDALRGLKLESNGPGTAHLLIAAQVPDAPAANHRLLLLALALPLAGLVGMMAAVLARKSDKRLYSALDLEEAVGVTPMSVMPVSYGYSEAAQNEHLLRLAAGLERGHRLNRAQTFVFTAASESMQTSELVRNVQSKLNELGFKAAVMEAADMRQAAAKERQLEKSENLLERLKREHTFLLIDARPLLSSADTEYAVSCADATLVVAESGTTTGAELKQCMLLLQQLKATGVGTILQKASDVADVAPVRKPAEVVEHRQKTPEWERVRGFAPKVKSPEMVRPVKAATPVRVAETKKIFKEPVFKEPEAVIMAEIPKRVQLVPTAVEPLKPVPAAFNSVPEIRFEEAVIAAPASKQIGQQEFAEYEPPVMEKKIELLVAMKKADPTVIETPEEKAERIKREAVARVRARFGMPAEVIEALAVAMAKPVQVPKPKQESVLRPVAEPVAAAPVAKAQVEETRFEQPVMPEIAREVPIQEPARFHAPAAEPTFAAPQPPAVVADLPPVRRVTVQHERPQPATVPVVQWTLQPERRRVPRDPIVFPRGLNKAALRMQEKGQAVARGLAGPSLTAAEQAVASKVSSTQHPVAAQPVARRREESAERSTEPGGRWSLLRQFGGFAEDEQDAPRLDERAAG